MSECSLPMYDWIDLDSISCANNVIFTAVQNELQFLLKERGLTTGDIEDMFVETKLQRPIDHGTTSTENVWASPKLLWSQICAQPLYTSYPQLVPVGTPIYSAKGCTPGKYSSFIVVRSSESHRFKSLESLAGSKLAVNSFNSWSGAVSLCCAIDSVIRPVEQGQHIIYFDPEVHVTGSHRASLAALKQHKSIVQCAAVDCITWDVLRRVSPAEIEGLSIIQSTQAMLSPPIVMQRYEESPVSIEQDLFSAFQAVCSCAPHYVTDTCALEALSDALQSVGIVGFLRADPHAYEKSFTDAALLASSVKLQPWSLPAVDAEAIGQLRDFGHPASAYEYFVKLDASGYNFPVSTTSNSAQSWISRGMQLAYGFNHEQALTCFLLAARADPACIMAHWGVAYNSGVNYNAGLLDAKTMKRCWEHASVINDMLLISDIVVSDLERALCEAITLRALNQDIYPGTDADSSRALLQESNKKYADFMRNLYEKCLAQPLLAPGSLMADITALTVEAIMNMRPWKMWPAMVNHAKVEGLVAIHPDTLYAQRALEAALGKYSPHPGLAHFYVHLMEMAPVNAILKRACSQADVLRRQYPACGHLLHMASHIDVQLGAYSAAIDANVAGIVQDDDVARLTGVGRNTYYHGYRVHNHHMLCYAAMFAGRGELAISTTEECMAITPESLIDEYIDYLEPYMTDTWHALIRFGRWEQILSKPLDFDRDKYVVRYATALYSKALALVSLGRQLEAQEMQKRFEDARAAVPPTRFLHNVSCVKLMEIASAMLDGELGYRDAVANMPKKRAEWAPENLIEVHVALAKLSMAARLEDALPYDEPWGWMQPVRHAIGALALEQAQRLQGLTHLADDMSALLKLSESAYREDLDVYPRNIWSLTGLHTILTSAGTGADGGKELKEVSEHLRLARLDADPEVSAMKQSCFCAGRLGDQDSTSSCCSSKKN